MVSGSEHIGQPILLNMIRELQMLDLFIEFGTSVIFIVSAKGSQHWCFPQK